MFTNTVVYWFDLLAIYGTFLLTCTYAIWQWRTLGWWKLGVMSAKRPQQTTSKEPNDRPAVSVLIPVRNEADNIGQLLSDLLSQTAFTSEDEIIVINDHSTDSTDSIVRSFAPKVRLLELSDYLDGKEVVAHKKAALTYGVREAQNEWIVTTDGDCRWPSTVLAEIKKGISEGVAFISGPVLIAPVNSFLTAFQALDLLAYMSLTAAYDFNKRPILANGAHLSFSKQLFLAFDGYGGIDHLPSGDDVLLLQKVQSERPDTQIKFLLNPVAAVTTKPMATFASFWAQRLRWAGKTGEYSSSDLRWAQGISFATSLAIISVGALGFWHPLYWTVGIVCGLLKAVVDYWVLRSSSAYFGQRHLLKYYPMAAIVHPFYLVAIGAMALIGKKASWKDRST